MPTDSTQPDTLERKLPKVLQDAIAFCQFMNDWPDRVYVKDDKHEFLWVNKAVANVAGLSTSELIGKTDQELFCNPHSDSAWDDDKSLLEPHGPMVIQVHELETWSDQLVSINNGAIRCVSTTKKPLFDESGRRVGTIGITRDLTAVERENFLQRIADRQRVDPHFTSLSLPPDNSNCGYWWESQPRDTSKAHLDPVFQSFYPGATAELRMEAIHESDRFQVINAIKVANRESVGYCQEVDYRFRGEKKTSEQWVRGVAHVISLGNNRTIFIASHRFIDHPSVADMLGRTLMSSFPGILFVKDAEGRFQFMNSELLKLSGYSINNIRDKTDEHICIDPEERAEFQKGDERVLQTGRPYLSFETLTLRDRPKKELMTIKLPIPAGVFDYSQRTLKHDQSLGPRHEAIHILGISIDISGADGTSQLVFGKGIRDEKLVFEMLFSRYTDAIYMKELHGSEFVYVKVNDAFCRIVGLEEADIIGKTVKDVWGKFNPDLVQEMMEQDARVFRGEIDPEQDRIRKTNVYGLEKPEYRTTKKVLLRDFSKEPWRILGVSRNVTDLVRATKALDPVLRRQMDVMTFAHREVAIMFCDIRGFSRLAAMLSARPDILESLYSKFFDRISELSARYNCIFDKLQGDGGLFIGGLSSRPDFADTAELGAARAARFALELCRTFRNDIEIWHKAHAESVVHVPDVRIGVGIHIGKAFAGLLDNDRRLEFTAFGDDVNMTQRIESAAGRSESFDVLVSARVASRLEPHFVFEELRAYEVKDGTVIAAGLLYERQSRRQGIY